MRPSSSRTALAALTLTLVATSGVSTHRREDYLQAARIALQPDAVEIDLDLTPGLDVAESFIATIDADRDGSLSTIEQRRYADQAVGEWAVALDGTVVPMHAIASTFSDADALRRGQGTIRLRARASLPGVSTGAHQLFFKNTHLADHSAYLANALVPDSARVSVTAQRRTSDQSELTIEYALRPDTGSIVRAGLLVSLGVITVLILPPMTRRFRTA